MRHPEKWRETVDPFSLGLHTFRLNEVLGYPHAGNDVFQVRGMYQGAETEAYIKSARHREADLKREATLLLQLSMPELPRLLDHDEDYGWLVTEAKAGQRLSVIVGDNADGRSMAYLAEYGEMLARLHELQGTFPSAPHRRFMGVPDEARCQRDQLDDVRAWLLAHRIEPEANCFCHGDFHYGNVLWQDGHISGILDLELAGWGDREFDIAWAMIRRPGQKFMTTQAEEQQFLEGYRRRAAYDPLRLCWYMINAYAWFYGMDAKDEAYRAWVRAWLRRAIQE